MEIFGTLLDAGKAALWWKARYRFSHVREKTVCGPCCTGSISWRRAQQNSRASWCDRWRKFGRQRLFAARLTRASKQSRPGALCRITREIVPTLAGQTISGMRVRAADDFESIDPVDGSRALSAGHYRILLDDGSRVVFRLSGTGTEKTRDDAGLSRALCRRSGTTWLYRHRKRWPADCPSRGRWQRLLKMTGRNVGCHQLAGSVAEP